MMLLLFFLPLAFAKKPEDRKFDLKGPLAEVADEFMVREVLLLREYGAYARGLMGGAIRSSSDMSDGVHPPVTSKVFQSMAWLIKADECHAAMTADLGRRLIAKSKNALLKDDGKGVFTLGDLTDDRYFIA